MNWALSNVNSRPVYQGFDQMEYPNERSLNFFPSTPLLLAAPPGISHHFNHLLPNFNNMLVLEEQKKEDQEFIKQFVLNLKSSEKYKKNKKVVKISEAKSKLLGIISLKKLLEKEGKALSIEDKDFASKWMSIEKQMNEINNELDDFISNIEPLKKSLAKRLKKRNALKKRNINIKALRDSTRKKIEEKHIFIDKWLEAKKEEVEAAKREAAMKRQADAVLHEVRRKKSEGSKMLNLLSALAKLRDLKVKEEEKNGGYSSKQLTEVFNGVIERFKTLWKNQLEIYKLEEKGLKIMLEENSTSTTATKPMDRNDCEINYLQWEKLLFGDIANDENEKILTRADEDLETFLQVRRNWDRFIVTEPSALASSMPLGWVLPPEKSNAEWAQFLVGKDKERQN